MAAGSQCSSFCSGSGIWDARTSLATTCRRRHLTSLYLGQGQQPGAGPPSTSYFALAWPGAGRGRGGGGAGAGQGLLVYCTHSPPTPTCCVLGTRHTKSRREGDVFEGRDLLHPPELAGRRCEAWPGRPPLLRCYWLLGSGPTDLLQTDQQG